MRYTAEVKVVGSGTFSLFAPNEKEAREMVERNFRVYDLSEITITNMWIKKEGGGDTDVDPERRA